MKSVLLTGFLLVFSTVLFAQNANNYKYGLSFNSHLSSLDLRTGLDLNPTEPFKNLKEGFSLSFEIRLRRETQSFGYILRVVSGEKSSLDILSNVTDNEFNLVYNDGLGQEVKSKRYSDSININAGVWLPVEIKFLKDKVEAVINKKTILLTSGFQNFNKIQFYFGGNNSKYFHTTDVPPFTLRDVRIRNNGSLIRYWRLAKHANGEVIDEIAHAHAKVQNGVWEINQHTDWKNLKKLNFSEAPQIAYDDRTSRVFLVTQRNVFIYNAASDQIDTVKVSSGNPYFGVSRQIVYSPKTDELLSYTVQSPIVYTFSFKSKSWSGAPTLYVDSRQHHNHFLDTSTNTLNVMMGYGYHNYATGILKKDLNTADDWISQSFKPNIHPRYLSALGVLNKDEVLLLGGYGSKSGKQEEFPHNFYDLHKINVKTGATTKLWDLKLDTPYVVFGNSMFVDSARNQIFALGFNNFSSKSPVVLYGLTLDTDKPTLNAFGNALPFKFLDVESYCDLFHDKSRNQLIALTSHKITKSKYEVSLYGISYPVFGKTEVLQQFSERKPFYYIAIAIFLFAGIGIFVYRFARKRRLVKPEKVIEVPKVVSSTSEAITKVKVDLTAVENKLTINLFGGFQFLKRDGIDCTNQFTPVLKQIFIFLLLHSFGKGKFGVSSHLLDQTFWFGMSQEKATNNRSVNIRKLRILLTSLGNIEIVSKNGNWLLNINEDFDCDYYKVSAILEEMVAADDYDKTKIEQVLKLAKGKLLPDVESEWLDDVKTKFISSLVKKLLYALQSSDLKSEIDLRIRITEVILLYDSLEENAIVYRVNLLYKLGQKGQSKSAFDKYFVEYQQALNAAPSLDYNNLISLDL